MKRENINNNTNYYEILLRLREYEHLLLNTQNIQEVDMILLKIKNFIFSNTELKEVFSKYLTEFNKIYDTEDYIKQVNNDYEHVKSTTYNVLKNITKTSVSNIVYGHSLYGQV